MDIDYDIIKFISNYIIERYGYKGIPYQYGRCNNVYVTLYISFLNNYKNSIGKKYKDPLNRLVSTILEMNIYVALNVCTNEKDEEINDDELFDQRETITSYINRGVKFILDKKVISEQIEPWRVFYNREIDTNKETTLRLSIDKVSYDPVKIRDYIYDIDIPNLYIFLYLYRKFPYIVEEGFNYIIENVSSCDFIFNSKVFLVPKQKKDTYRLIFISNIYGSFINYIISKHMNSKFNTPSIKETYSKYIQLCKDMKNEEVDIYKLDIKCAYDNTLPSIAALLVPEEFRLYIQLAIKEPITNIGGVRCYIPKNRGIPIGHTYGNILYNVYIDSILKLFSNVLYVRYVDDIRFFGNKLKYFQFLTFLSNVCLEVNDDKCGKLDHTNRGVFLNYPENIDLIPLINKLCQININSINKYKVTEQQKVLIEKYNMINNKLQSYYVESISFSEKLLDEAMDYINYMFSIKDILMDEDNITHVYPAGTSSMVRKRDTIRKNRCDICSALSPDVVDLDKNTRLCESCKGVND